MSDPFLLALSPKVRRAVALILNAIELNPVLDETHQCVTLSDVRCHSKADVPVGNVSWPACRSGRGGEAQVAVERSSWSHCVLH